MMTRLRQFTPYFFVATFVLVSPDTTAATFTNNASIQVASDPSQSLTSTSGVFTVSCWFKLSIPSSASLANNLTILMDRADGNEAANHCYHVRFNISNGDIEFVTKGASATFTKTLIQDPYPDRWYHLAIIRNISTFSFYVDGRPVITTSESGSPVVGNATGAGMSIGGIGGTSRLFYGDVIEVAFYQAALSQSLIQDRMFKDQSSFANIKGYYKFGYSTSSTNFYRNVVPVPAAGTDPAVKVGSGNIDFEETDQAGEQSIFDSRKNKGDDAIAPLSGAFSWSHAALARPVPGISFDFEFGYGSATPTSAPTDGTPDPYDRRTLGPGWRHSFDSRITADETLKEFRLLTGEGGIETFTRSNIFAPFYVRHKEYRGELVQLQSAEVEWTTPERLVYRFRDPADGTIMAGRLLEIRDFNTNSVLLHWNEDEALLTNIVDTVRGQYLFRYDTARSLLTNVSFAAWSANFTYDTTNRLVSHFITNTSGLYTNVNTTWQFQYGANGLLSRIIDPRGFTNVFVQYDQYGRLTNQVDALSRSNRTRYGVSGKRQITRIDPTGHSWVDTYDRKGHVIASQDPLTNITRFTYDTFGNRTSITEPLGYTTTFGYDERSNKTSQTNELGQITRWAFHPFFNRPIRETNSAGWVTHYSIDGLTGNVLSVYDAVGTNVSHTYATNGLLETTTDANGHTSIFTHNADGFLVATTDPATNTTSYLVNDLGWHLAVSNALGQVTAYTYDLNGNVVRTVDPLYRVLTRTYDGNENLTSLSDAKGQLSFFSYDVANQRTQSVDRAGFTNRFFYTSRGKLERMVDSQNNSATNFYDAANRLIAVHDSIGQTITNLYDANGNLLTRFDQLGRPWSRTYDRLNRVITESNPLGNTKSTTYDELGRVKTIASPLGYVTTHAYDGRDRLTNWLDAEGFKWDYDYDGVGNITNITDARGGRYVMAYGPRNERILERNQDGFEWRYRYDQLLRPDQQTDPNGTVRTATFDEGGRIDYVTFSTGRVDDHQYDENNNVILLSRSRPGQPPTSSGFDYDAMDRITEYTDAFSKKVKYSYDSLGRVTTLTYPGNLILTYKYDALNRLTNQVDWAGRQLTYRYDKANRLVSRTYPNGVLQTNTFDFAGRITSLSYSNLTPQVATNPIAVALAYAYDRNGNKVGMSEQGTLDWPEPTLHDETATYTPSGRLINKLDSGSASNDWTYTYDPSGNMTNAASAGQTFTLTYDEDNRVTAIHWDCGLTSKNITNRYDALGRRVARTVDGVETRFVLDLQGNMERILCDLLPNGQVTARYVHGPDLAYKVSSIPSETLTCYHSDAQANVIALTDSTTNVVAQFAYTPYGRSLGSQLSTNNPQPYTFVGNQGVMEELPGLYFMRARYYSADAGVFLSTDPVKKIGPTWMPSAYSYGGGNPAKYIDPDGRLILSAIALVDLGYKAYQGDVTSEDLGLFFIGVGLDILGYATTGGLHNFAVAAGVGVFAVGAALDSSEGRGLAGVIHDGRKEPDKFNLGPISDSQGTNNMSNKTPDAGNYAEQINIQNKINATRERNLERAEYYERKAQSALSKYKSYLKKYKSYLDKAKDAKSKKARDRYRQQAEDYREKAYDYLDDYKYYHRRSLEYERLAEKEYYLREN